MSWFPLRSLTIFSLGTGFLVGSSSLSLLEKYWATPSGLCGFCHLDFFLPPGALSFLSCWLQDFFVCLFYFSFSGVWPRSCLGVDFFGFISFGILSFLDLHVTYFGKFGEFSTIISSNTFSATYLFFFLSSLRDSDYTNVRASVI